MKIYIYVPLDFIIKHHYITVDFVEHSTSVIDDDFCVVSRVPVTVPVRPLGYLTWGNAFYQIFEVGDGVPLRPTPLSLLQFCARLMTEMFCRAYDWS